MRRSAYPPSHLLVYASPVVDDLPARLARLKEASGLSWEAVAACLGVDPRQLQRWRKGTMPSGEEMIALFLLADRVPAADACCSITTQAPRDLHHQTLRALGNACQLPGRLPQDPLPRQRSHSLGGTAQTTSGSPP